MGSNPTDILTRAIERNSAAVLSLPAADSVLYCKSRFLGCVDEHAWLESVPGKRALLESLIQTGAQVEISFKAGARQASFTSQICRLDSHYRSFNSAAPLQAIQIIRPASVIPPQRRSHYRVSVRSSDQLIIRLWPIAEEADLNDQPPEAGYLPTTVHNLSVGGVGLIFHSRPPLLTNQRMRILLQQGDSPPMLLEGRPSRVRTIGDGNTLDVGIHFENLHTSLRGRQTLADLTRIVAALQLQEVKRARQLAG